MTTIPNTGLPEQWLQALMPDYPGSSWLSASGPKSIDMNWLSASTPKAADTNTVLSSESPEPIEYLITGDMAFRCFFLRFSPPSTRISDVRPTITAVVGIADTKGTANIIKHYLQGGTVAIMTKDGKTITANNVRLDDFRNLSKELDLRKTTDGSYLALVVISADSRDYRSN